MRTYETDCPVCDAGVEVEWRLEGRYIPATYIDPPEYPDVVIHSIHAECEHEQDEDRLLQQILDHERTFEEYD